MPKGFLDRMLEAFPQTLGGKALEFLGRAAEPLQLPINAWLGAVDPNLSMEEAVGPLSSYLPFGEPPPVTEAVTGTHLSGAVENLTGGKVKIDPRLAALALGFLAPDPSHLAAFRAAKLERGVDAALRFEGKGVRVALEKDVAALHYESGNRYFFRPNEVLSDTGEAATITPHHTVPAASLTPELAFPAALAQALGATAPKRSVGPVAVLQEVLRGQPAPLALLNDKELELVGLPTKVDASNASALLVYAKPANGKRPVLGVLLPDGSFHPTRKQPKATLPGLATNPPVLHKPVPPDVQQFLNADALWPRVESLDYKLPAVAEFSSYDEALRANIYLRAGNTYYAKSLRVSPSGLHAAESVRSSVKDMSVGDVADSLISAWAAGIDPEDVARSKFKVPKSEFAPDGNYILLPGGFRRASKDFSLVDYLEQVLKHNPEFPAITPSMMELALNNYGDLVLASDSYNKQLMKVVAPDVYRRAEEFNPAIKLTKPVVVGNITVHAPKNYSGEILLDNVVRINTDGTVERLDLSEPVPIDEPVAPVPFAEGVGWLPPGATKDVEKATRQGLLTPAVLDSQKFVGDWTDVVDSFASGGFSPITVSQNALNHIQTIKEVVKRGGDPIAHTWLADVVRAANMTDEEIAAYRELVKAIASSPPHKVSRGGFLALSVLSGGINKGLSWPVRQKLLEKIAGAPTETYPSFVVWDTPAGERLRIDLYTPIVKDYEKYQKVFLDNSFALPRPTTLYRQVTWYGSPTRGEQRAWFSLALGKALNTPEDIPTGAVVSDAAQLSTSTGVGATWNGEVLYKIRTPQGFPVLPVQPFVWGFTHEAEVVLPPGTGLRIKAVTPIEEVPDAETIAKHRPSVRWVIDAEAVHPNEVRKLSKESLIGGTLPAVIWAAFPGRNDGEGQH